MEKREPAYTFGGNVNWCSHCGKTIWKFLKELKIELPYDPAIAVLSMNLAKTQFKKIRASQCSLQHYLQQQRHGSNLNVHWQRNGQRGCSVHKQIHNAILLSHERACNTAICSNVDGPRDYHANWGKSERERQTPYAVTYCGILKNGTNQFIYGTEMDSQTSKTDCGYQRGKAGGGVKEEIGIKKK